MEKSHLGLGVQMLRDVTTFNRLTKTGENGQMGSLVGPLASTLWESATINVLLERSGKSLQP